MTGKLDGKVILITGAASGIGRATALKLASLGATLSLSDINQDGLAALLQALPPGPDPDLDLDPGTTTATATATGNPAAAAGQHRHTTHPCDVGASAQCDAAVADTLTTHGRIDGVFNCAGINPTALPIADTTDAYFDRLVNTNLRGPYNITRAVVPHLVSGAAIVNVASVAGLRASPGYSIYNATKFGVIGFTKSMALELGPKGIRVNCVAPGPIDTPTMAGNVAGGDANDKLVQGIALGRIGQPEEIADVVAFLFSDESRFMNGSVVEVSGGMK